MYTKTFDKKRTIIFIAIAFGYSYAIGLYIWLNGGLQSSEELVPGISGVLLLLIAYMFGPALANILTRLITKEGWTDVMLRPKFKQGWKFWLLAWIGTPVLIGVGTVVFFLVFPEHFDAKMGLLVDTLAAQGISMDDLGLPIAALLAVQVVQAVVISPVINAIPILGEEFGWRAYLQPKLMPLGPKKALIYSNILWGLWHAPIIAMGYNYGNFDLNYFGAPWTGILMMTLACVWFGIFFGWASYKAKSVWPAVIGHGSLNGIAATSIYLSKGTPVLLLGPTAIGLIGGVGFILASIAIFTLPGALDAPADEVVPAEGVIAA